MTRICPQCERDFTPKAKHQIYDFDACRQQGWVEKGVLAAQGDAQRVEQVPTSLDEARAKRGKRPTDRDRIRNALRAHRSKGIHSHEIRKLGLSGNPSQRITELEELGYEIEHTPEFKGHRPGVRYRLLSEPGQSKAEAA